jgi:hypothetical protein
MLAIPTLAELVLPRSSSELTGQSLAFVEAQSHYRHSGAASLHTLRAAMLVPLRQSRGSLLGYVLVLSASHPPPLWDTMMPS